MVYVAEQAPSLELSLQVIEATGKVRKAVYSTWSFHNVDFEELAHEHELMY